MLRAYTQCCRAACQQEIDFHRMNNGPAGGGNAARGGLRDVRADLEGAVNSIFAGGPAQRRAVVERLYAKACALPILNPTS